MARREVKGIVIDKAAESASLFNRLKLRIKSLDLNGRTDAHGMFYRCTITEFGEVIGSENITNTDFMFNNTTCSIYPPMAFPKCTRMLTFKNAPAPNDIPDVQYAPMIQEINGIGIDAVGNGIPPGDDGARMASRICEYLFGETAS